jgi:hypothetical protein
MILPIRFPDHSSVVADEAARFRRLSQVEKMAVIEDHFRLYQFLASNSPRRDQVESLAIKEEVELNRSAVVEGFGASRVACFRVTSDASQF